MILFIIFLILMPSVHGLEIFEAENFVMISNNYEQNISYSIIDGEEINNFSLAPNESISLEKKDFEILENVDKNLMGSFVAGKITRKKESMIPIILIAALIVLILLIYLRLINF